MPKPEIPQSLLNQLPIKRFEDARFNGNSTQNMIYFYWYFTMEDDRLEVATVYKLNLKLEPKILN